MAAHGDDAAEPSPQDVHDLRLAGKSPARAPRHPAGRSPESYAAARNPVPRILTLFDILMKFSSETRGLTRAEILMHGYPPVSAKTFRRDIAQLGDWVVRRGHQYHFTGRSLDRDDLMLLTDLARASRMLPESRVRRLLAGVREELTPEDARFLDAAPIHTTVPRLTDESTLDHLTIIRGALFARRQLVFRVFEHTLDGDGRRRPQADGAFLRGTPLRLVTEEGFYLLDLKPTGVDAVKSYRLDRMYDVRMDPAPAESSAATRMLEQTGHPGGTVGVMIEFDPVAIEMIVDRFGEEYTYQRMKCAPDGPVRLIVDVVPDAHFLAWVMEAGGHVRIVRPRTVLDGYRRALRSLVEADAAQAAGSSDSGMGEVNLNDVEPGMGEVNLNDVEPGMGEVRADDDEGGMDQRAGGR